MTRTSRTAVIRLRAGVGLIILSWLPVSQIYIWAADLHGEAATRNRLIIWTLQFIIGFIGLALAGVAAKAVVKTVGWRRLPVTLLTMLRTGKVPDRQT